MVANLVATAYRFVTAHLFISLSLITFFGVAGIRFFAEPTLEKGKKSIVGFISYCCPLSHWLSGSNKIDVVMYVVGKFSHGFADILFRSLLVFGASALVSTLGTGHSVAGYFPASPAAMILTVAAMMIAADFGQFFSHYLQHKVPVLWEFHKVHHSATFLTPLTSFRVHPVAGLFDALVMGLCAAIPAGLATVLCGFTPLQVAAASGSTEFVVFFLSFGILSHSNIPVSFGPLDRLIVSPVMHQVHHSVKREHWDKNFGTKLSIWDGMFGTIFLLPKGERIKVGLGGIEDERGDYTSISRCLVGPFVNGFKRVRGNSIRGATVSMPATEPDLGGMRFAQTDRVGSALMRASPDSPPRFMARSLAMPRQSGAGALDDR